MPRKSAMGAVRAAVEEDLTELAPLAPRASKGLRETARVLADVLDSDAPATAKVQASKTLTDVLMRLAGRPALNGGGDGVDRLKRGGSRRRSAVPEHPVGS